MSHKLSLPRDLTLEDDTFSKDLLRQFDKRRSRLHYELGFTTEVNKNQKKKYFLCIIVDKI